MDGKEFILRSNSPWGHCHIYTDPNIINARHAATESPPPPPPKCSSLCPARSVAFSAMRTASMERWGPQRRGETPGRRSPGFCIIKYTITDDDPGPTHALGDLRYSP